MPVLFSDAAADMVNLIYWGLLSNIVVTESDTTYQLDHFSALETGHKMQHLKLKSTNKPMAENFIRS